MESTTAPRAFAMGLTPLAANLAHTAREWPPAELFWVVKNGIKMRAMPAWSFRLDDTDLWAVVAFVGKLPELSPVRYREWRAGLPRQPAHAGDVADREADAAGREATAAARFGGCDCAIRPAASAAQRPRAF